MNIEIEVARPADTAVLRHLYELYSHDFSEYTLSDVDDSGMYTDDSFLTEYWREPNWSSFLVRVDGRLAGFAWVLKTTLFSAQDGQAPALAELADSGDEHALMEEFFIVRKYRRQGVGEIVARQLFDRYPAVWEVSEMAENTPAQAFWRKVIGRYAGGDYVEVHLETDSWHGPVQVFHSRTGRK